ncbi:hypothetical protein AB1N83_014448 [Pleurotus pulmonarius]
MSSLSSLHTSCLRWLQAHEMKLRCRFYASHGSKPIFTSLGARCDCGGSRYAYLESLLDDAALQPYVHDCLLTVKERNRLHRFRIFFKRHTLLPLNGAVQSLGTAAFKGDVVIARVAVRDEVSLVNMRARDGILADFAMRK